MICRAHCISFRLYYSPFNGRLFEPRNPVGAASLLQARLSIGFFNLFYNPGMEGAKFPGSLTINISRMLQ
jgi:hypothetical protein